MSLLGLAYECTIFQLLDLKTKKVFEFSHHRHLKPIDHDLAKLFTKSAKEMMRDFVWVASSPPAEAMAAS
jgi:hypothetical protein